MTRKKMLWIAVLIPLVVSLMPIAFTQYTSTIYIDPAAVWDPTMEIGTEFSIDICVDYVENLWAYQAWLAFDPTIIHGVSYENGPFIGKDTDPRKHPVIFAPGAGFDNEAGELKLFGAFLKFTVTPPHDRYLADGGGVLATVTFVKVGDGSSAITLGADTKLADKWANEIPSVLEHGAFSNEEGPELYIRTKGAHGVTGIWPEWSVGLVGWEQTLYCRVMNYGFMGAWVSVEFNMRGMVTGPFEPMMSELVWLPPAIDKGEPSEVTVFVSFTVLQVEKVYGYGRLYFKAGIMPGVAPYDATLFGGEGISRSGPQTFKVQEHI